MPKQIFSSFIIQCLTSGKDRRVDFPFFFFCSLNNGLFSEDMCFPGLLKIQNNSEIIPVLIWATIDFARPNLQRWSVVPRIIPGKLETFSGVIWPLCTIAHVDPIRVTMKNDHWRWSVRLHSSMVFGRLVPHHCFESLAARDDSKSRIDYSRNFLSRKTSFVML